MSVIITFMFEPAKLQMNWASASGRINLLADTAPPELSAALPATGISVTRYSPSTHQRSRSNVADHAIVLDTHAAPLRFLPCVDVHAATSESVNPSPPARDVEQLQMADALGKRRVDDEVVPEWLEAEHRSQ
jgi:hypothetical protein